MIIDYSRPFDISIWSEVFYRIKAIRWINELLLNFFLMKLEIGLNLMLDVNLLIQALDSSFRKVKHNPLQIFEQVFIKKKKNQCNYLNWFCVFENSSLVVWKYFFSPQVAAQKRKISPSTLPMITKYFTKVTARFDPFTATAKPAVYSSQEFLLYWNQDVRWTASSSTTLLRNQSLKLSSRTKRPWSSTLRTKLSMICVPTSIHTPEN